MLDIYTYICEQLDAEQLIFERNENLFPKDGDRSKMEIWVGDHA